jgi:ABC-2 type transport system permease protein
MRLRPGLRLVIRRELRWIRRRPVILCLTLLYPLLLISLLMVVFNLGVPSALPVVLVDRDNSALSRQVARRIEATPEVAIAGEAQDLAAGKRLILSGRAYGLVLLPEHLERDSQRGRRPEVVLFYDKQFMLAGGLVWRGVSSAVASSAAGLKVGLRGSRGQLPDLAIAALQPIEVQQSALFNPSLNYVHFLLAAIVPTLLQIIIATTSVYSFGLELDREGQATTLRRLGGGRVPALLGKLLPYTAIFLLVMCLSYAVLFGPLGVPLRGSAWLLLLASILFVLSTQLIGALAAIATGEMVRALSVVGLFIAPAFGFMGISFPRFGMNAFAEFWGALIPGTWFLQIQVDQTLRGAEAHYSLPALLVLALYVVVLAVLTLLLAVRRLVAPRRTGRMAAPAAAGP